MSEESPTGLKKGGIFCLGALSGCGFGCVAVAILAMLPGLLMMGGLGGFGQIAEQAAAEEGLRARLAELEALHPPRLPEDTASALVTDADVDRFLGAWSAVEPPLVRLQSAEQSFESMEDLGRDGEPSFGEMFEAMKQVQGGMGEMMAARQALAEALVSGLEQAEMGPTDFRRFLVVVDGAFLGRDAGVALVGDVEARWQLDEARWEAESLAEDVALAEDAADQDVASVIAWEAPAGMGPDEIREELRRRRDRARVRLERLERHAGSRLALSDETRRVLEARRSELEARADAELRHVAQFLWSHDGDVSEAEEGVGEVERDETDDSPAVADGEGPNRGE